VHKLTASDASGADYFGFSVDVDLTAGFLIVGAHIQNFDTGAAYIFEWNGQDWGIDNPQESNSLYRWDNQKLMASDGLAGDHFGFSVSIRAELALIGSYNYGHFIGSDGFEVGGPGAAYLFQNQANTWTEVSFLQPSDPQEGSPFVTPNTNPRRGGGILAER